MKINRSTVEQAAWYVVLLVVVAAIAVGVITWNYGQGLTKTTKAIEAAQLEAQQSAKQAREDNAARQNDLKNYIKCLALARFDVKPEVLATRLGTSKALDECADPLNKRS